MPKIDVYDINGKKVSDVELNEKVFGIEPNETIVHSVLVNYLANQRQGTQSTKTRAEVRGGGKKPWRQKGTGRARAGSSRSPIWVGGGTVFGPTGVQNHKLSQNRKEHKLALRSAYSSKVKGLVVVDSLQVEAISTKAVAASLKALNATGKVLVVLSDFNEKFILSANNINNLVVTSVNNVSVYDLMYFDHIVMEEKTLHEVENLLKEGK